MYCAQAMQYAQRRMKSVASNASILAAKYPRSGLLKYVAEQRAVQSSELDAFLEEVER